MMKNMKAKLFRIVQTLAFCAVLLLALARVSNVLERKESASKFTPFFEQKEDFDVLFIGNSHTVNGILPLELYDRYGVVSYNLGGYGNSMPLNYWVLKNALDYTTPRVVVVDIHNVGETYMLSGTSGDEHKALDAFPLTRTKYNAIEDLMSDPELFNDEGDAYVDLKWEFYFPIGKYHSRWNKLTRNDFAPQANQEMGAESFSEVVVPEDYWLIDENQASEEYGCGYEYLRRIITDCQALGCGVVLTHLPYPCDEHNQMDANAVWYIADEYGIDFFDFVSMDQVVDYRTDLCDPDHLNASGAKKITDFLGRYLTEHFQLEDRRGDSRYAAWENSLRNYHALKTQKIQSQQSLKSLLMLAHDNRFSTAIALRSGSPVHRSEQLTRLMHNIAREHIYEEDMYAKWSDSLFPLETLDAASGEAYFAFLQPGDAAIIEQSGDAISGADTGFGRIACTAGDGITAITRPDGTQETIFEGEDMGDLQLVILDNATGAIVKAAQFWL